VEVDVAEIATNKVRADEVKEGHATSGAFQTKCGIAPHLVAALARSSHEQERVLPKRPRRREE